MSASFHLPERWPKSADPGARDRLLERFTALGRNEARLAARPDVQSLLAALGGNSPYLSDLVLREPAAFRLLVESGPETAFTAALAPLAAADPAVARPRLAALLRQAKREVALVTAIADIGGIWKLERICAALSDLAEHALRLATCHLLLALHRAGQIELPDPAAPDRACGFVALGMGKLGARELNYSSDVDLVLLFDPAATRGEAVPGAVHARLARDLASLMEARDSNGYVFRIDFRLRPDPAATPPAVSLPAALAYYEGMARNWERAAMLKARPVAGDLALGAAFLEEIRPFVWRRYLDFAAIDDIHAMRRRIDARVAAAAALKREPVDGPFARLAGHNLKLGAGGIREIEFIVQTLQLIWGGRDPGLRVPATLAALPLLARAGLLPPRTASRLAASYRFLRNVEHRLQMVADRQTHSLPDTAQGVARFATFMGGPREERFARTLLAHLREVEARYRDMFEPRNEPDTLPQPLDLRGVKEPPPAALQALTKVGFTDPAAAASFVQGWQTGRLRAIRSERAQALLFRLLPQILAALGRQRAPDAALSRFDALLSHLPSGVQILSLFQRHPALLERVAAVLGAAPSLAEHLARNPLALEGLIETTEARPEALPDPSRALAARLAPISDFEDAIDELRSFVQTQGFRISVATLEGRLDADAAGIARAAIADAALAALLPRVLADFARRFGRVPGGRMAVIALGKAGGREMMAGSDLDLMLIYDHPPAYAESRGKRHLPASEWFIRAAHAFIAALSAPGAEGPVFAVDMRLRPSGNKGPVAVSLSSFRRYHALDAWTWERMALTRARVVAGQPAFRAEVTEAIRNALNSAGPAGQIRADAAAMRARLARELPPAGPWDIRLRAGGLMEVEFIAQVLQLMFAPQHPELWQTSTRAALQGLAAAAVLSPADGGALLRTQQLYRTVLGVLRVALGSPAQGTLPEAVTFAVIRAVRETGEEVLDVAGLSATLDECGREVRRIFERLVGPIAEKTAP
ncbi:MAG: bifunctional [glutamine synthetase] adenylyltransferase/[glutamine synthetase]-adenylyl-L-tyrosine phosphorylase [Acetobacteraceae bacterium]